MSWSILKLSFDVILGILTDSQFNESMFICQKKAHRMNKKTHTLPRPLWYEACATTRSHIQPYTVFHCNAFRFLKTSIILYLDVFGVYSLLFFLGVPLHRIWNMQLIQSMAGSTVQPSIWFTSLVGEEPWPALRTWSEAISSYRKKNACGRSQAEPNWISVISYGLVKKQLVTAALQVVCSYQMSIILQTSDK